MHTENPASLPAKGVSILSRGFSALFGSNRLLPSPCLPLSTTRYLYARVSAHGWQSVVGDMGSGTGVTVWQSHGHHLGYWHPCELGHHTGVCMSQYTWQTTAWVLSIVAQCGLYGDFPLAAYNCNSVMWDTKPVTPVTVHNASANKKVS